MGGVAADMGMRLSRGVIISQHRTHMTDPEIRTQQEKEDEYYELKKRYRDSDLTTDSSDLHPRAY